MLCGEGMVAIMAVCKQCGQPIIGEYITALGAAWHPEHFVCAGCGKVIVEPSFNTHDGRPYHNACYLDRFVPKCAYCGKALEGQYITHDGKSYHQSCYQDHIVPRCAYCGEPLIGSYVVDGWGTRFHQEHEQQFPHCAYCGRLVPPAQQEHGASKDDNVRCPICRAQAIETREEAQPLFRQLIQWVGSQGLRFNSLHITLELGSRSKLGEYLSIRTEGHSLGVTMSTSYYENECMTHTEIDRVAVLQGMPELLFQGVTVHELGHVWLAVQGIHDLPQWADEGFCELLSHRYLSGITTQDGRYYTERIEKNSNPIYGEGFRKVKALADKMGFARFIEVLVRTKRLPS